METEVARTLVYTDGRGAARSGGAICVPTEPGCPQAHTLVSGTRQARAQEAAMLCQHERGSDHAQIVFCYIRDGLRRGGGRCRAGGHLRPGTRGLRLSVHGPAVQLSLAGPEPVHGVHGHCPGQAKRSHGGAAARQEFLRSDLGSHHHGIDRRRLSRRGARPDRLLQIHQAGALPVQFPAAGPQYPCAADLARHRAVECSPCAIP
jgi:hypothetical protein